MPITISGTTLTYNDGSTETTNTPNTTAGLGAGAIGTYAFLSIVGNTTARSPGTQIAGSSLRFNSSDGNAVGSTPSGSWRLMGELTVTGTPKGSYVSAKSVWLRYA